MSIFPLTTTAAAVGPDARARAVTPHAPETRSSLNGSALPGAIAILIKNFEYGGTQRVLLHLANKLHEFGHEVHVLCPASGPLETTLCEGVGLVRLKSGSEFYARLLALRADPAGAKNLLLPLVLPLHPPKGLRLLAPLARYLRDAKPAVLISATASHNVITTLAKRMAGVSTRLILTEHVTTDLRRISDIRFVRHYLPDLMRHTYRDADAIVGVSKAVTDDLRELLRVPDERVQLIYNPAVPDDVKTLAAAPVDHPWFGPNQPPVVLSAGRADRTKDFATLVSAIALLRRQMHVRLVILSSALPNSSQNEYLNSVRRLAQRLGVADDFEILDFTPNPFAYMARAGVFASSSTSEGFGNVVAESLACGCPVVSTRTRGPVEVLEDGRYGRLVPTGDVPAMAAALGAALRSPRDSAALALRAATFNVDRAARAYQALCCEAGAVSVKSGV
jgi:glycosyltransferase involved in cell wall biosynthesis